MNTDLANYDQIMNQLLKEASLPVVKRSKKIQSIIETSDCPYLKKFLNEIKPKE